MLALCALTVKEFFLMKHLGQKLQLSDVSAAVA